MGSLPVLKIDLMLKDRVLKSYVFTQDRVEIGRVPTADIFIDNSAISRAHSRIERSIGGPYIVKDLGSTNGTYLNDEPITEASLEDDDVISIGKFFLKVSIEESDTDGVRDKAGAVDSFDGTTVLSQEQVARLSGSGGSYQPGSSATQATRTRSGSAQSSGSSDLIWWALAAVVVIGAALVLIFYSLS